MKDLRLALLAALVASLGLVACGGDDDNMNMPDALRRDSGPDAPRPPDGGGPPDGGVATCGVATNLMDISALFAEPYASVRPLMTAGDNVTSFFALLNSDMKPDAFALDL